jgi:hypothetical protein
VPPPHADVEGLLRTLRDHEVRFIVVGGVAAVLHGAPIGTFDLDIVHDRSADNVERLLTALKAISAIHRDPGGRAIAPSAPLLQGPGHNLLVTDLGALDVLGAVGNNRDFESLRPHAPEIHVASGLSVSVLNLETQIELKRETGREKDRAALPTLLRTLQERGGRS